MNRTVVVVAASVGGVVLVPALTAGPRLSAVGTVDSETARTPSFAFAGSAPDADDDRFGAEIDLVIETAAQYAAHNEQMLAHPEWFEDLKIGVTDVALNKVEFQLDAEQEQEQSMVDALDLGSSATSDESFESEDLIACTQNRGAAPSPTTTGRWLTCSGGGNGAAYFVATASQPGGSRLQILRDNVLALTTTPTAYGDLGYYSHLEDGEAWIQSVDEPAPGRVVVDFNAGISDLVGTSGTALTQAQEQLLRTTLMYAPSATLVLTLSGSCEAYHALSEAAADCSGLTSSDLQPRVGW